MMKELKPILKKYRVSGTLVILVFLVGVYTIAKAVGYLLGKVLGTFM